MNEFPCHVPVFTDKPRFTFTRIIRTRPHHYAGQFALSLGKESPYIFSKFNPLNTDTPLIRALSTDPSMSVLTGFDCISFSIQSNDVDTDIEGAIESVRIKRVEFRDYVRAFFTSGTKESLLSGCP